MRSIVWGCYSPEERTNVSRICGMVLCEKNVALLHSNMKNIVHSVSIGSPSLLYPEQDSQLCAFSEDTKGICAYPGFPCDSKFLSGMGRPRTTSRAI